MMIDSGKGRAMLGFILVLIGFGLTVYAGETNQEIKTGKAMVAEVLGQVRQITAAELKEKMDRQQPLVLLDVRTERERNAGYISGSVWIPRGVLEFKVQTVCPNPDKEIIVYCRKGGRSLLAVDTLTKMGYRKVSNLDGGINRWGECGYLLYNWHGAISVKTFDENDPRMSTFDIFDKTAISK